MGTVDTSMAITVAHLIIYESLKLPVYDEFG